jgi:5'-nucleotidase
MVVYIYLLIPKEDLMKRFMIYSLTVVFASMSAYGASGAEIIHKPLSATILHFNDHHGYLDESKKKLKFGNGIGKVYTKLGGFPRIASEAKRIKAANKNTLFLVAGDAFSGTLYHTLFQGQGSVDLLNELRIDAFTLGNHEFDGGDKVLKEFIDKAVFPIVSANVEAKAGSTLDGAWKPYIIKEIDGAKVGIIGIDIAQKTKVSSRPSDDISFYDEIFRAQKYADELKTKGVNKIILLSHFGYKNDIDLASKVSGIDIIIDGDSHTLMGDFSSVGLKSEVDKYPVALKSKDGKPMCIAQAWAHSMVLGELHVEFDADGILLKCDGVPHLLIADSFRQKNAEHKKVEVNATVKAKIMKIIDTCNNITLTSADKEMSDKLSVYKEQLKKKSDIEIGSATEPLKHIRIPTHTYGGIDGATMPLGSDIAPVVSKAFYEASLRADACIQNAGGTRISIPSGKISYGTAYTLLPFSNTLFEIDMKGSDIKQVLEDAIINFKDNDGSTGSFPYAYGLRYDLDMTKPKFKRVLNLEIMDRKTRAWSAIDMDKTYVIVTNNYIAEGRDGYGTFKSVQESGAKAIDTYIDYAESFVEYIKGLAKSGKGITKLPKNEHCIKSYKE